MGLLERLKDAMPSDQLQRIFSEIIETINEYFRLDEEYTTVEASLLLLEGELRSYTKKDVSGLLSTKVINIRKDVD
jgi:hypothetical protein